MKLYSRILFYLGVVGMSFTVLLSCAEKAIDCDKTCMSPVGLSIIQSTAIRTTIGTETSIIFRVNPSTAELRLETGEDVLELDVVDNTTRFETHRPENLRLVEVQAIYEPTTHKKREGEYMAVIDGVGEYEELLSLVLTCNKGTEDEYQVSSTPFAIISLSQISIDTGLPILIINTPGNRSIDSREEWVDGATMVLLSAEGQILEQGLLSVKGRGNVTWGLPKKPYALKLEKKASLLGMKENKRWCLLANWFDRTLIRNAVGFEIARMTELDWTPTGQFVELVLNGEHVGNYYLCEQIRTDASRLNLSGNKSTADDRSYLLELDTYYDEMYRFKSPICNLPYQIKDPETVTAGQLAFVKQYVGDMETALYDAGSFVQRKFAEYIDFTSFIDYWFVYEITQCSEPNLPKSVFLHKDIGGKMKAGPVWDFDMCSFGYRHEYSYELAGALYYPRLFEDNEFRRLTRLRWDSQKDKFRSIETYIDELASKLERSERINYAMWPITLVNEEADMTYEEAISRMKRGIREKIQWLDDHLPYE